MTSLALNPDRGRMLNEKLNSNILSISIEVPGKDQVPHGQMANPGRDENEDFSTPLFEQTSPGSFAEQFPRLVFCTVAFSILLAAITAEIDCLRGAGYYWP